MARNSILLLAICSFAAQLLFVWDLGVDGADPVSPRFEGSFKLFDKEKYQGESYWITYEDFEPTCVNIVRAWNDRAKSIELLQDTTCIVIFEHKNCMGNNIKLEPSSVGTYDLGDVEMKRKVSSYKPC